MNRFRIFSVVAVVALLMTNVVAAQSIPGAGWWSGEQVQNVGSSTASIVVTAYDASGSATYTVNSSLAAGASVNFNPASFSGMPNGFQGSAVVSSDQPIKAIVNVTNQLAGSFGISGGRAMAQYQGTESTGTTLYFPNSKHNRFGKTVVFYIQNAGSAAATATAVFRMDNGSVYNYTTPSIGPNKMVLISPADAGVPSSPSDGTRVNIGSMTVSSSQPLAGVQMEYSVGESIATVLNGTRGFTSADFDTVAYAPIVKRNRFGRFTGIQVQNVSSGPINVTIDYKATSSNCTGLTAQDVRSNIAPGASTTVVQQAGTSNFQNNCTGTAIIQATGDIVAIVNEANVSGAPVAGITYSAIPASAGTTKISAPLFKDDRFGLTSGMQIQNIGTSTATNVVATFICKGNNSANTPFTAISNPRTIPAGGGYLFYRPTTMPAGTFTVSNPFSLSGANCGVTITSDQPVVTIINETPTPGGTVVLDDNNYEGFNLAP